MWISASNVGTGRKLLSKMPLAVTVTLMLMATVVAARAALSEDCASELRRANDLEAKANEPVQADTRAVFREILAIRETCLGTNAPSTVLALGQLALVTQGYEPRLGLTLWSNFLARTELSQRPTGSWHLWRLQAFTQMAVIYLWGGEFHEADRCCQQAAALISFVTDETGEDGIFVKAQMYLASGRVRRALGDNPGAISQYLKARDVLQNSKGNARGMFTAVFSNLGAAYRDLGRYPEAIAAGNEALNHARAPFSNLFAEARVHDNLAQCYRMMTNYSQAKTHTLVALRMREQLLGTNHVETAMSYANLGGLSLDEGQYEEALDYSYRALHLSDRDGNVKSLLTRTIRENITLILLNLGRTNEAIAMERECLRSLLDLWEDTLSFASVDERLAFQRSTVPSALGVAATLADREPTLIAEAMLRLKGIVLDSLIEERRLIESAAKGNMGPLVFELREAQRKLHAAMIGGEAGQVVENLQEQVRKLESELARSIEGFSRRRHALTVTTAEIQSALPVNTVLVEFIAYTRYMGRQQWTNHYGALLLRKSGMPRWIDLGGSRAIDDPITTYSTLLRLERTESAPAELQLRWKEAQNELVERLWSPIQRELPLETTNVVISPDSLLSRVPFAALWTGRDFVGERFAIRYVTSGRDLLPRDEKSNDNGKVVIFADPDFDYSSASPLLTKDSHSSSDGLQSMLRSGISTSTNLHFERLEKTATEALSISNTVSKHPRLTATIRTGREASEAVLSSVSRPFALHLTTHGHWFGFPLLTNVSPVEASRARATEGMLRSCIVLAGANRSIESWANHQTPDPSNDGFLMADEAALLDLSGTWLVCLSACNTAVGDDYSSGEGVFGLRRAFALAGAQNIVSTLWPVQEEFSAKFMAAFYEEALKKRDATSAFNLTQRRFLRQLYDTYGFAEALKLVGPFVISTSGQ